jgi:hypothetical protein
MKTQFLGVGRALPTTQAQAEQKFWLVLFIDCAKLDLDRKY